MNLILKEMKRHSLNKLHSLNNTEINSRETSVSAPKHTGPDIEFLAKVIRRQSPTGILLFLCSAVLLLPTVFFVQNPFTSTFVVAEDKRDSTENNLGRNFERNAPLVYRSLPKFDSPEFLLPLAVAVERDTQARPKILRDDVGSRLDLGATWLRNNIFFWSHENKIPNVDSEIIPNSELAMDLTDSIRKRITVNSEISGLSLRVELKGKSPEDAFSAANLTALYFIRSELEEEKLHAERRADFYNRELAKATLRLKEVRKMRAGLESASGPETSENSKSPSESHSKDPEGFKLREEAAELTDRIRTLEDDLNRLADGRLRNKLKLESEFKGLQSKLQGDHPDVKSKQSEILEQSNQSDKETDISLQLRNLRRRQWDVRAKLSASPISFQLSQLALEEERELRQLQTLSQQYNEMLLEKDNLANQLSDPASGTRFRLLKEPSYDLRPVKNLRLRVAAAALILAALLSFTVMFLREFMHPIARDAWRVQLQSSLPILTQISLESLRHMPRISPTIADDLRASLGRDGRESRKKARTLLAYRRLELSVFRHCKGNSILLANAGENDSLSPFFFSFMNIVSTDNLGRIVFVDCNHIDPLFSNTIGKMGLSDYLSLDDEPSKLVALRHPSAAFDLIPPSESISGEQTRVFQREMISRFILKLKERYTYIFIRAFPESHFIENAALLEAVSDCIICIDAQRTLYRELERTMIHLESNKVRGIVMVGS